MVVEKIRAYLAEQGIEIEELAQGTGIDKDRLESGLYRGDDLGTEECMLVCRFLNKPFSSFVEPE